MNRTAVIFALISAALFGASTPAAKTLLGSVSPVLLAGILYLGAGLGVAVLRRIWRHLGGPRTEQARIAGTDWGWLTGAVLCGGVAGPILLMVGLVYTDASTASLLLTLEGAATASMAWFIFGENVDRRVAAGMGLLFAGTVLVSWSGEPSLATMTGPLAIIVACVAWGLDNNLTRKVALADPLQIVEIKGLVAGPVNIAVGLLAGNTLPVPSTAILAGLVGFLGYGVSLALFVAALRHLGAARTGAYFSTAPFVGAAAAIALLGEPVTVQIVLAGALMAVGVWLHLTERHEHRHAHAPLAHEHSHMHDEHHRHPHGPDDPPGEPHSHRHRHGSLIHSHPHTPDAHHRHRH